jgi:hypothetical protein
MSVYRKEKTTDYPGWFDAAPSQQEDRLRALEMEAVAKGRPTTALFFCHWRLMHRDRRLREARREHTK